MVSKGFTLDLGLGLLMGGALWMGCSSAPKPSQRPELGYRVDKLLVLPFADMYRLYGENVQFSCQISCAVNVIGEVEPEAPEMLTAHLLDLVNDTEDFAVIAPDQIRGIQSRILRDNQSLLTERDLVIQTGLAVNADAVLMGRIYRFINRRGTDLASDRPASVAFDLFLLKVPEGSLIWYKKFDETQIALSENIYKFNSFMKRGGRWVTAQQMAQAALDDIMEGFPIFF